jgi:hypothetical protein
MVQGWSQASGVDKDKTPTMLVDWIPEGDGLLEAGALRKRAQDEWGCVVTTPPHMTAKKGKVRPAIIDTLGYTEIMGPIFDAGIWETAVGCEGNPSKIRLRVALTMALNRYTDTDTLW